MRVSHETSTITPIRPVAFGTSSPRFEVHLIEKRASIRSEKIVSDQIPICLKLFISNERFRERVTVFEITRGRRRPAYDSGGVGGGDGNDDNDDDGAGNEISVF